MHQALRVLYNDPEPEFLRGVDKEDLFAACSTISKTEEGVHSEKKKEETPSPSVVAPTFVWQQTRATLPDKLNTLMTELQKPYKRQKILDELPYFEQIGSAPVNNAPKKKDGDKEKHA